jgi:carboxymethylenebutenolidase
MPVFNHIIAEEDGKEFRAHIEYPPNGAKGPGLILLHEVYGVNDSLKEVARDYARKGFVVMCPNMYWRLNPDASYRPQSPNEELTDDLKRQREESYALMEGMDYNLVGPDMQTAIDYLRNDPACTGKVGAMGVCLGGRCAFLAAAETDLDAGVALYATRFKGDLPKAPDVSKPFIFIVPGRDPYVTEEEKTGLVGIASSSQFHVPGKLSSPPVANPAGNPNIATHVFPFQDHAFARVGGLHYDATCAGLAHSLATDLLKSALADGQTQQPPPPGPNRG